MRRDAGPQHDRASEGNRGIDGNRLVRGGLAGDERIEADRELALVPLHTFQMLGEKAPHGQLPRGTQIEKLAILVEEDLVGMSAQILVQQETLDFKTVLRIT